jgi:hypothetical protein
MVVGSVVLIRKECGFVKASTSQVWGTRKDIYENMLEDGLNLDCSET